MSTKMSKSEAGKLGRIASENKQKENYQNRIINYNTKPNKCQNCNSNLPYGKRKNKFCSQSCAAKYNNRKYPKRSLGQFTPAKRCLNCNSLISSKFCNTKCQHDYNWKKRITKIETGKETNSRQLKKYLLLENGHQCNKCKNTTWNKQPIPIELEHIDGNSSNNCLNNLELLCPNCHAQTPTYKNKNRGNGRHERKMRYQNGLSY